MTSTMDSQASGMLELIDNDYLSMPLHTFRYQSFAFYNGRERWAGIEVERKFNMKERLYIIFGECRNSDNLCVQTWVGPMCFNPPTITDVPNGSYDLRKYFDCNDVRSAMQHIQTLIDCFATNVKTK